MNLHSPKDEHCGFATDDMTTSEIKKLLVEKMLELKGVNYAVGWLKTSYIFPMGEEIERSVAIKQLKEFDSEVV
jgi:hypothetical protein